MKPVMQSKIKSLAATSFVGIALLGILGANVQWPVHAEAANEVWSTKSQRGNSRAETESSNNLGIDAAKLNQAFTTLAESMSPAVVNIYTRTGMSDPRWNTRRLRGPNDFPNGAQGDDDLEFFFGHPFGGGRMMPRETQALGSGFVINTDGTIVTNAHVVRMAGRNADEIMVKFIKEESNKGHLAKIVGVDEATDVAVLKLVEKLPGLKVAPLGDSDRLKVGEWAVAIGNPYGHTHTVTQGIISAIGRSIEGTRSEFIQTSASINPGNSGGPLFNLNGEVIAINTAIDPRAQGIGFAIPINSAKTVITQLLSNGKVSRGWLGLAIQDLNDELRAAMRIDSPSGVIVRQVVPREPAAKAGLAPYDVITRINGTEIHSSRDLVREVEKTGIGKSAELQVVRGSEKKTIKVEIGEQPTASATVSDS